MFLSSNGKAIMWTGYVIAEGHEILQPYADALGYSLRDAGLRLAEAIVASDAWVIDIDRSPVFVYRDYPTPLLMLFGDFDEADVAHIEPQLQTLSFVLPTLTYIDYQQSEELAAVLAEKLLAHRDLATLAEYSYIAIPRGGHIVLGQLLYQLGIQPQLVDVDTDPNTDSDSDAVSIGNAATGPVVIVDDSLLSGHRFAGALRRYDGRPVIFAHLFSSPVVRQALCRRFPQIVACIAAADLSLRQNGQGRAFAPDALPHWASSLQERAWLGQVDHVAYRWSEPDRLIMNTVTERVEPGWNIVPPERRLGASVSAPRPTVAILRQPDPPAGTRLSPHVVYATMGETVLIAESARGATYRLDGVAAGMWTALLSARPESRILADLAAAYAVDRQRLAADFYAFVDQLTDAGLLTALS